MHILSIAWEEGVPTCFFVLWAEFFDELFKSLPWPLKLSWWRKTVLLMARCPLLKIQTLDGRASHLRALNVDDKDLGCFQGNHVRVIMMDVVWSGLTTTGWRISKWDLQCCWAQIHWIIHFAALSFWILEAARCTLRFPCCEILYSQIVPNVHNSSQIVAELFFYWVKKILNHNWFQERIPTPAESFPD